MRLSTRKALRTCLQVLIGGAAAVPALAEMLDVPAGPVAKVVGGVVVAAAIITKLWNAVEAKWPSAGSWLLRGPMVTTDAATGESVATPTAAAKIDAGYGTVELVILALVAVVLVLAIVRLAG